MNQMRHETKCTDYVEESDGQDTSAEFPLRACAWDKYADDNGTSSVLRTSDATKTGNSAAPPDGGWGWMVVAAAFFTCVVLDGVIYAFGIYLVHLEKHYGSQKGEVAWSGSLLTGLTFLAGPVAGALSNRFGYRKVWIAGSILSTIGILLGTISPNLWVHYMTYGIMGGVGFAMMYLTLIVAVGNYFTSKRALATGITLCGSGAGAFVIPPLTQALITTYGWQGAMLITAGIVLNCAACGAVAKPLDSCENAEKFRKASLLTEDRCDYHQQASLVINTEPGVQSLASMEDLGSSSDKEIPEKSEEDDDFQSNEEVYTLQTTDIPEVPAQPSFRKYSLTYARRADDFSGRNRSNHSIPSLKEFSVNCKNRGFKMNLATRSTSPQTVQVSAPVLSLEPDAGGHEIGAMPCGALLKQHQCLSALNDTNETFGNDISLRDRSYTMPDSECSFPPADDNTGNTFVTYLPGSMPTKQRNGGWLRVLRIVANLFRLDLHWKLLKYPPFVLLCIANIFSLMGYYVPFVYLTDNSIIKGIPADRAAFLLSITGISNIAGKIVLFWIVDIPKVRAMDINNLCLVVSAASAATIPFCWSYPETVTAIVFFSLFGGVYVSLISLVLVDMVGIQNLTSSFGFINLFRGVGSMTGSPIAGSVFDVTRSYNIPFFLAGGMLFASAVLTLCLPCLGRFQDTSIQESMECGAGEKPLKERNGASTPGNDVTEDSRV